MIAVLARSDKIVRKSDGSGFDLKSCDNRYTYKVARDGDVEVVLAPKLVL